MKARWALVLISLLLLSAAPGLPEKNNPSISVRRWAWAQWEVPDRMDRAPNVDFWSYRIWVRRTTNTEGQTRTRADLTRYACQGRRNTSCRVLTQTDHVIPNEAFVFDDTLETASVDFRAQGMTHSAAWVATSQQGGSNFHGDCDESPVGDNARGFNRYAEASGRVLGRDLRRSQSTSLTFLTWMVDVQTC